MARVAASQIQTLLDADVAASEVAASSGGWEKIGADSTGSSSTSSSASDDMVCNFKDAGIPDHKMWAKAMRSKGYNDMEDLLELSENELDHLMKVEVGMPSGVQRKLKTCLSAMRRGEAGGGMPRGDIDANVPVLALEAKRSTDWKRVAFYAVAIPTVAVAAVPAVIGVVAAGCAAGGIALQLAAVIVAGDCLDGETEVTMANREKKQIKDMKAGDKILAYNNGKLKHKTVVRIVKTEGNNVHPMKLRVSSGEVMHVKATGGHPFYVKNAGWSVLVPEAGQWSGPVQKLQKGNEIVMMRGKTAKLLDVGAAMSVPTFNLVLDGPGGFFVHNMLSHSGLPQPKTA